MCVRVFISESCPLILPFHVEVDRARELCVSSGSGRIGTTGKGIGQRLNKVARRALRVQDLDIRSFAAKLKRIAGSAPLPQRLFEVWRAGIPADLIRP